jgi:aspartyl-tRNA(Asn)/glutamyl-tRNA(Gln) amidotransferase subunit A
MDLTEFTIAQTHEGLKKKEFSAVELTKTFLKRIEQEDKNIFSFLTITQDLAIAQAKLVDELIFSGQDLPILAGIPMAVKDNILVDGIKCTAASKILGNYTAPYDATVVKKLKKEKAVIVGKTNLDEFAMGSSTENSAFGPTRNPRDLSRVPGGSSGGSAAAVAANFCCYALGSDTGGSIRLPASFCGVAGLKPTYGAVSRYGLMAMASSLDQIGPLTKTVEDCRIVFNTIKGRDEMDSTSVETQSLSRSVTKPLSDLVIGLPREYFIKGIDSEVEKVIREAIKKYEEEGAKIVEISLPHTEYALSVYYIIMASEVSANLERYDGIKYGYSEIKNQKGTSSSLAPPRTRAVQARVKIKNLLEVYLKSRENGFGTEARRRIMLGTYVLSAGYYEAYYLRAQKVRTLIRKDFERAFEKVDVIVAPVSPTPAFKIGEKITDPLTMYLSDVFTVSANLAGLPGLSVPCGQISGLPVGLQIIGRPFAENQILEAGEIIDASASSASKKHVRS